MPIEKKIVTLTQANEEGFDAKELGVDLEKFTNVQIFCVTKIKERVNDGHLHYVTLEFIDGDVINPTSDPLIFCTIRKQTDEYTTHCEHRAFWDNKLWRILDDDAGDLLELLHGIKKTDVAAFAAKLHEQSMFHGIMVESLRSMAATSGWKEIK